MCVLPYLKIQTKLLTLIRLAPPPPSTFRAITLQRAKLSPRLFMTIFFRVSPHILTPNLRFRSYVTFCTCTSDRKRLKMWVCVQNQCKLIFFSLSSYKYAYFYSQWLILICFSIIVLQKVSTTNFTEKTTKTKGWKNKEIHKKSIKQ